MHPCWFSSAARHKAIAAALRRAPWTALLPLSIRWPPLRSRHASSIVKMSAAMIAAFDNNKVT
jgi:hypothetical protein